MTSKHPEELIVACEKCGAVEGELCRQPSGRHATSSWGHKVRRAAARDERRRRAEGPQ